MMHQLDSSSIAESNQDETLNMMEGDHDEVLVLDLGEVKEFDAPAVLLSNKDSLYSQLVEKSREVE